jgi:hypothetical protein
MATASQGPADPGHINDDFASLPASAPAAFANPAAAIGQAARITCRVYHPSTGHTVVESNVIMPLRRNSGGGGGGRADDSSSDSSDDSELDDDMMDTTTSSSGGGGPTRTNTNPNNHIHEPHDDKRRAYWIQRTIRKAIYGKVKMGVVLRPRRALPQSGAANPNSGGGPLQSNEPEAEWEVTSEKCAIKEMEWARIRSARGKLAENPIGEVGALHFMQQYSIKTGAEPRNVLVPLDLLSDDQHLYLITPYCNGGELFDVLEGKEKFTEEEARYWMKQVLQVSLMLPIILLSRKKHVEYQ